MVKKKLLAIGKEIYKLLSPVIVKKAEYMVAVSYIPEPFCNKNNINYLNKHQNRREILIIADVFHQLGLGYRIERFDKWNIKKKSFDIIFGIEPNFVRLCKDNPHAIKIYYATGSYFQHQNAMIKRRTDDFNIRKGAFLSYRRLVKPHLSCEIADYIFQIGSQKTLDTYPVHLRHKIKIIHQSCHHFQNFELKRHLDNYDRSHFLWVGSHGSILKGLDLVLDYFLLHPQLTLHIIGYIDNDFYQAYKESLKTAPNIIIHGFIDMDDPRLLSIVYTCSCIIFPSCSEGMPGSVINMMKLGIIPIVSQWCSTDEIDQLGYEIPEISYEQIDKAIQWFHSLSAKSIRSLIYKNYHYANSTFNSKVFEEEFKQAIISILNKSNVHDCYIR